ncbi:hypothetical protein CB1_000811007 [Camelus ferus]|nr:hypothetical protein CB1_000811007 [Camelus ferus]
MEELVNVERVCVRGGLYEVDVNQGECYPVYWNHVRKQDTLFVETHMKVKTDQCKIVAYPGFVIGLYLKTDEMFVKNNKADKIPVMRGQWFIDGTWQPLEEEESNKIEQEHLSCFRGQQMQENFDIEVSKPIDGKDGKTNEYT